jgi:hypothetical protein
MSRPGATFLSILLLTGAILLSEALILRDKNQAILHQRNVTATLNHCKATR